jgi:hypothetical protein
MRVNPHIVQMAAIGEIAKGGDLWAEVQPLEVPSEIVPPIRMDELVPGDLLMVEH